MTESSTYDVTTDVGKVRLLLNDVATPWVFTDAEVQALLDLEGGTVKLAAAQAIDAQATNEALAAKVLRDADGKSTDGAKLADAMRRHAAALREQAVRELEDAEDGFFMGIVDLNDAADPPELTAWPFR